MQSTYTLHITPAEWRWVISLSVCLVLLAFLPFIFLGGVVVDIGDWQFMGLLHNYEDGATYISKMMLGKRSLFLTPFQHTSEPHTGVVSNIIYSSLGRVSALTGVEPLVLFHVSRVVSAVFMYLALYQLSASIWMRVQSRQRFFLLAVFGSGLGWLVLLLTGSSLDSADFSAPEAFPLQSSLMSVHVPLALACLALIISIVIMAYRPGAKSYPDLNNNGLILALLSLFMSVCFLPLIVPLAAALVLYVGIHTLQKRRWNWREVQWLLTLVVPAIPAVAYYLMTVTYNPAVAIWNAQNIATSPSPLMLLIGFGVPFIAALPGIWRALRRFEADGDQFMILWLMMMVLFCYLPFNIQRYFLGGAMIPIAYFATRSVSDFWAQRVQGARWAYGLVFLSVVSTVCVLFLLPTRVAEGTHTPPGFALPKDYRTVFNWLQRHGDPDDVVLAAPNVGLWIPAFSDLRVVYGHPVETLNAGTKHTQVTGWYADAENCDALLNTYDVAYVLVGPEEKALGSAACVEGLSLAGRVGEVAIYQR